MHNNELINSIQAAVDAGLRSYVSKKMEDAPVTFRNMLYYQLGWAIEDGSSPAYGKRTRPALLLLVCNALGGDWHQAIPAAVGVELLHNFTLIHDDIQDKSPLRRGRDTVWVKWGEAQAINAGDAMFALACSSCYELRNQYSSDIVLTATELLHQTAYLLTGGQYLDMAYEKAEELDMADYWKMIQGKTGELLSTCFALGAMLAGINTDEIMKYRNFGLKIGAAFQVQDDWLGIWGNQIETGKSVQSDLYERKKTFPILMALQTLPVFRHYWNQHDPFMENDIEMLMSIVNKSQISSITQNQYTQIYEEVMAEFPFLFPLETKDSPLREAIIKLIGRSK